MKYRPEIDGLRAVAVLPVLLFHAGFSVFSGGYVGVDVFFVISGYLITLIIIEELNAGKFSIIGFYERRARRIIPVLIFVILCCTPFAWYWMMPDEFEGYARSTIAVAVFMSNVFFWKEGDYFAPATEEMPLLHTWSLAVEEQFYLLFPLVLAALWRFGCGRVVGLLTSVALCSLILSHWAAEAHTRANFYLAPSRAWELLAGSLCAFALTRNGDVRANPYLAALGLAAIVYAILMFDNQTPFPSFYALVPVGGAALIILFADHRAGAGYLLATAPFVGIGLISYSAYLWHQPVFALARVGSVYTPSQGVMLVLAALSLGLAYLSWRFVEQPFRRRSGAKAFTRRQIFVASGVTLSAAMVFAVAVIAAEGNLGRYSDAQIAHLDQARRGIAHPAIKAGCGKGFQDLNTTPCVLGDPEAPIRISMIGDSHARRWIDALHEMGLRNGWRIEVYTKAACAASDVTYFYYRLGRAYHECTTWRRAVTNGLRADMPDLMVMTASSKGYTNNRYTPISIEAWADGIATTFADAVDEDTPKIWLFDNPRFNKIHPFKCFTRVSLSGYDPQNCKAPYEATISDALREAERAAVEALEGGIFLDMTDRYCDAISCYIIRNGTLLMVDSNHVSADATEKFAPDIETAFKLALSGGA